MAAGGALDRTWTATFNAMSADRHSDASGVRSGACDSCGAQADDLAAVHRVYVTPAAWDTEEKIEVLEEVERWCFPCRSQYPHQPLSG
jgi:hypothetical protein